jgi:hypothetical protein
MTIERLRELRPGLRARVRDGSRAGATVTLVRSGDIGAGAPPVPSSWVVRGESGEEFVVSADWLQPTTGPSPGANEPRWHGVV